MKKYQNYIEKIRTQVIEVLKDSLVNKCKYIKDLHVGNCKGLYDCDGFYFDVCDTEKGKKYPMYLWGFTIYLNTNHDFKLKMFGNSDIDKKIRSFINSHKKSIIQKIDWNTLDKYVNFLNDYHEILSELYSLKDSIEILSKIK